MFYDYDDCVIISSGDESAIEKYCKDVYEKRECSVITKAPPNPLSNGKEKTKARIETSGIKVTNVKEVSKQVKRIKPTTIKIPGPDNGIKEPISSNGNNEFRSSTMQNPSINPNSQQFQNYIAMCEKQNVPEMAIIICKLLKCYNEADLIYKKSFEFQNLLAYHIENSTQENFRLFPSIKHIRDELKFHKRLNINKKPDLKTEEITPCSSSTILQDGGTCNNNDVLIPIGNEATSSFVSGTAECDKADNDDDDDDDGAEDDDDSLYGFDVRKKHQIRKLEKIARALNKAIHQLEEAEIDWDEDENSSYIKLSRYRERLVKVWNKRCTLRGICTNANRTVTQNVVFSGNTGYPDVEKAVEKVYNRTRKFPDYHDVVKIVKFVRKDENLNQAHLNHIASIVFKEFGKLLKLVRQRDDYDIMCSYYDETTIFKDPASMDKNLAFKLEENNRMFNKKEAEVMEKYVKMASGMELEEVKSDNASIISDSESITNCSGDQDDDLDDDDIVQPSLDLISEENAVKSHSVLFSDDTNSKEHMLETNVGKFEECYILSDDDIKIKTENNKCLASDDKASVKSLSKDSMKVNSNKGSLVKGNNKSDYVIKKTIENKRDPLVPSASCSDTNQSENKKVNVDIFLDSIRRNMKSMIKNQRTNSLTKSCTVEHNKPKSTNHKISVSSEIVRLKDKNGSTCKNVNETTNLSSTNEDNWLVINHVISIGNDKFDSMKNCVRTVSTETGLEVCGVESLSKETKSSNKAAGNIGNPQSSDVRNNAHLRTGFGKGAAARNTNIRDEDDDINIVYEGMTEDISILTPTKKIRKLEDNVASGFGSIGPLNFKPTTSKSSTISISHDLNSVQSRNQSLFSSSSSKKNSGKLINQETKLNRINPLQRVLPSAKLIVSGNGTQPLTTSGLHEVINSGNAKVFTRFKKSYNSGDEIITLD